MSTSSIGKRNFRLRKCHPKNDASNVGDFTAQPLRLAVESALELAPVRNYSSICGEVRNTTIENSLGRSDSELIILSQFELRNAKSSKLGIGEF